MIDYNVLKWDWSQRLIAVLYIWTAWLILSKPYAAIITPDAEKYFKGSRNLFKYGIVIALFSLAQYCFGAYRKNIKAWLYTLGGFAGADLFFLIVSYAKDGRLPTKYYFMSLLGIALTLGAIWWDSSNYVYEKREIKDTR